MFKDKLKLMINKCEGENQGNNKKKIENLVFLVIIFIIMIIIIHYICNGNKSSNKTITNSSGKQLATTQNDSNSQSQNNSQSETSNNNLEDRLEKILSNINGVGDVKVFINYSESSETVAMYNENSIAHENTYVTKRHIKIFMQFLINEYGVNEKCLKIS